MSTYKICDESVSKMASEIMAEVECYTAHLAAKVKIDFIFAYASRDADNFPVGSALRLHGAAATGICRILPIKQRQIGRGDAEISLDGDWWSEASREQQRALLDHEMYHIIVRQKNGVILRDIAGRPLLRMRPHDVEMGLFAACALRHGENSRERHHARNVMKAFGQYFWPELYKQTVKNYE